MSYRRKYTSLCQPLSYSTVAYKTWKIFNWWSTTIKKYCCYSISTIAYMVLAKNSIDTRILMMEKSIYVSDYCGENWDLENIFISGYSTTVWNWEKTQTALDSHREKYILVSSYSTTVLNETYKKCNRHSTLEKKMYFCFWQ